jgi:DNA-binding MarR family transcriptional regulator
LLVKHDLLQLHNFGQGFAEFEGFIKMPLIIVRTFGPRALTLSALASLPEVRDKGSTFRRIESIAEFAGLPLRTVKRHLQELEHTGAIDNAGRHHRRTVTRVVDSSIRKAYTEASFLPLPRMVLCLGLGFAETAVLSYCCHKAGRFAGAKAPPLETFSQAKAANELGINRRHVCQAIDRLSARGLLRHSRGKMSVCI